jgi:hypothetical protein
VFKGIGMTVERARRGRPRGSGLDDHVHLDAIRRVMAANAGMRPTTAIKAIGISDPSTIRRLRDKLRFAAVPQEARRPNARSARAPLRQTLASARPENGSAGKRRSFEPRQAPRSAVGPLALVGSADDDRNRWLAAWLGVSISAIATTLEVQIRAFESVLRAPYVAAALKHQCELNKCAFALCAPGTDVHKTLH